MKITESLKAELAEWLDTYWTTYIKGDYERWATFVTDDYYNIGGTKEEIWHSKQEILEYSYAMQDQMVGQAEIRNRTIEVLPYGDYLMVNEFTDLYVKIDGAWTYYGPFRMSSLMSKTETGWIALHQHGSYPDMKTTEGEAFAADALKAENMRLQKAVDQRTNELLVKNRELEIETALEKVRAVAMGMKTPDHMLQICRIISEQLKAFGVDQIRNVQTALIESKEEIYLCYQYFPSYEQDIIERTEYLKNPVERQMVDQMLAARDSHFLGVLSGAQLAEFRLHRKRENHLDDPLLDEAEELGYCFLSIGEGGLGLTLYRALDEESLSLFKRFHQVFSLAYQRFRDIQKAEAQAWEAQIEAALERVRSRSLAMHKSDELKDTILLVLKNLAGLGIDMKNRAVGIFTFEQASKDYYQWAASEAYTAVISFLTPYLDHPVQNDIWHARQNGTEFYAKSYSVEEKNTLFQYFFDLPAMQAMPAADKKRALDFQFYDVSIAFGKYSCVVVVSHSGVVLTKEENEIVKRFSKVFEQAYTRFLDLQKAEKQAREAEIELALERVRARTMAMHSSSELAEASILLDSQVRSLGIQTWGCAFHIYAEDGSGDYEWFSSANGSLPFYKTPREQFFLDFYERGQQGEKFYVKEFAEGECKAHYDYLKTIPVMGDSLKGLEESGVSLPSYQIDHIAFFNHGYILFITYEPVPESHAIFQRFAKVFEQTYTRFLDLQKAEAQAREAQVEAALEKVRSRSLAMHKSDELNEVVSIVFEKLKELQIPATAVGIGIAIDGSKDLDSFVCGENEAGLVITNYRLPYFDNQIPKDFYNALEKQLDFFVGHYSKAEKDAFYNYVIEHTAEFKHLPEDILRMIFDSPTYSITSVAVRNAVFNINDFEGKTLAENEIDIIKRFARVFDQAYTRFLDLQKAEAQVRESEIQLALERVRARTMAMQKSEELADAAFILFEQLRSLGGNLWGTGFGLCEENIDKDEFWFANENGTFPPVVIPNTTDPAHKQMYQGWQEKVDFLSLEKSGKALKDHYNYMLSLPEVRPFFQKIIDEGLSFPEKQQWNAAYFSKGYLLIITLEPYPDTEILKRFAKVFEQTYTRFLDLQKAETQAREAEIELALERVRARTMAMHNSDELAEASSLLFQQMEALSVYTYSSGFTIWDEKQGDLVSWMCNADGSMNPPFRMPVEENQWHKEQYDSWKKGDYFIVKDLNGEEMKSYFRYLRSFPLLDEAFKTSESAGHLMPERQVHHVANFSQGNLLFITLGPVPEAHEIFKRFAKVFDQTYTRFLDLQKAEEQAREAQIEAALERIRGQVASMRESTELLEIVVRMRSEFVALGHEAHYFWHMRWLPYSYEKAMTSGDGTQIGMVMSLPRRIHGDIKLVADWEKGSDPILVLAMETETAVDYVHKMITWGDFERVDPQAPTLDDIRNIGGLTFVMARTTHGEIGFSLPGSVPNPPQEAMDTLVRFAKVFDLAYKRFEDLKKAEHQTRETQIELALERVRSRSMAMQRSEELQEVIQVVYQQFVGLGIPIEHTGFIMDYKNREDMNIWLADSNQFHSEITFPYFDSPHWNSFVAAKAKGEDFFTNLLDFEAKNSFYHELFEFIPDLPKAKQDFYFAQEGLSISTVLLDNVGLYIENYTTTPFADEENKVLMRFGKVFQQTYTRFLDLQKAEAQAREAQIEAALERVRAAGMAMHRSEDLAEASTVLFEKLVELGVKIRRVGFALPDDEKQEFTIWSTVRDDQGKARLLSAFLHYDQHPIYPSMIEYWHAGKKIFGFELHGPDLQDYYKAWNKTFKTPDSLLKSIKDNESEYYQFASFDQGLIYAFTGTALSKEEHLLLGRFAKAFEMTYTRFLDIKKAEAQAREAQIEAGLERVRARAMAMHKSDELGEAAEVLYKELRILGLTDFINCGYVEIDEENQSQYGWMTNSKGESMERFYLPLIGEPILQQRYDAWKSKVPVFCQVVEGEELKDHLSFVNPQLGSQEVLEHVKKNFPSPTIFYSGNFSDGYLSFITGTPIGSDGELLLNKFTRVFELTYKRFLDLQKAEEQAREAQIEAALERVRSRSMAMHKSEELREVVFELFSQMFPLGLARWGFGIWLIDDSKSQYLVYFSTPTDRVLPEPYEVTDMGFHLVKKITRAYKEQSSACIIEYRDDDKRLFDDWCFEKTGMSRFPESVKQSIYEQPYVQFSFCPMKYGLLQAIDVEPFPEKHISILQRFTKVFEQTYTRFLDLQKAEAQAREAQIELSLERIRAQVTAMRQSDELFDIVVSMRKEFISLGHEADYFWHMKWTPENYDMSMTSEDGERVGMIISVPKFVHDEIPRLAEWEKSDSPLIALDLNGDEAWDYIAKMNTYGKYEQADPHAPTEEDIMAIGGLTFVIARTTHGEIGYSLPGQVPNPPSESTETLIRFAGVFDLAYRRFEDLLTAEKQNRKAKIELALERVRARALAMQEPEELIEVAQVMREEMGLVGVEELETSSIYINKNTTGKAECWYSIKDIRDGAKTYVADHFDLNYQDTWVGRQMLDFYQSEETKTSILMKGEDRIEWINYCANQSPKLEGYYGTEIPERTYHLTKFSNGAIGAATPGEISSESWDLLRRAALVFSLAYSRFKDLSQARDDLKKLKKAKAKAEKALKDLEAAQEQLVQQEKLASLGQLTAGIAHEIKNPLNFVNNFSDLSRELIEEVFEELENLEDSDAKEEIIAILNDVKANLSKVHEHGTRADSIVSSMLQHSRASGSKREPKAFNPLVKEFVNLSFHGMRAGKYPINVDIDLLLDPKVGDVPMISEDFSRVILNLCNNAFDAMRDKLKTGEGRRETEDGNNYLPKLTVKTALQKDKVILSIADNGGGIPEEIKDKILQPFFTTKKGTEGTGLGLSITHDIIKAHGGELKVESSQGMGSIFSIQLPLI